MYTVFSPDYWTREGWIARQKMKIVMTVFILFFISLAMSCQELRYLVSSKTMEVPCSSYTEQFVEHNQRKIHRVLFYSYIDGTVDRPNRVEIPMDSPLAEQKNVKIQYIPGRDRSRVLGNNNMVWVYIFFGSIAAVGVGVFILAKTG
jgi:hypothetical protein